MYQGSGVGGADWNLCSRYTHTIGKHARALIHITLDSWSQKLYDYALSFEDEVDNFMLSMASKLKNYTGAINLVNQIVIRQSCVFGQPIFAYVCYNCLFYQYV